MTRALRTILVATLATLAACDPGGSTNINGGLNASAYTWLEGRVLSASGTGVGFAGVGVRIPANRTPSAYAIGEGGQTDPAGDYDLVLYRVQDVGALPTPDTMTVYVIARMQTVGGIREDSSQAMLHFYPVGTTSDPQMVDIHSSIP